MVGILGHVHPTLTGKNKSSFAEASFAMVNLYAGHGAGMVVSSSQPPLPPTKRKSLVVTQYWSASWFWS